MTITRIILTTIISLSIFFNYNSSAQNSADIKNLETVINLAKFIEWPQISENNLTKKILYIITDENTPINYELQTRSKFNYKNWQVICSQTINNIPKGSVIFLMTKKNKKIEKIIKISQSKEILTISDNLDGFCLIGGMINIKKQAENTKIEINYKEINNKNMQISSKLLALAKIYD
ncbi:MAG: YfiR family protein [Bacteroidales bacterium]|nr:YfiR family protein [Bacteroidales bacterium]MBN2756660.1 YfiR family protein [Bacteroidales bacterium]